MSSPKKEAYSDYLQLDRILESQILLSGHAGTSAHEEMLFIIMHQTYELWFKQIAYDLESILSLFKNKQQDMETLLVRLQRIQKIFQLLIQQFEVMETMTPLEFLNFRKHLGMMSGFQSFQFRLVEIKLGLKRNERMLYNRCPFDHDLKPEQITAVQNAENQPTLFYYIEKWLENIPFLESGAYSFVDTYKQAFDKMVIVENENLHRHSLSAHKKQALEVSLNEMHRTFGMVFSKDIYQQRLDAGEAHLSHKAFLGALFLKLYHKTPLLNMPNQLLNAIDELSNLFTHWRFRHSLMVQKMIGWKKGTGGSSGVSYLQSTVEKHNIYTDLSYLPMVLIPEAFIPPLPSDLVPQMDYFFYNIHKA